MAFIHAVLLILSAVSPEPLPEIVVTHDDTSIRQSCRVSIPAGTVIADANGDGVLHIDADNITIEFVEKTELRGAPAATLGDELSGCGIRINAHSGVVLRNLRIRGFKVGVHATSAAKLTIESVEFSDNYRQHLKSMPSIEDSSDWLWPHKNDDNEWLTQYGAAAYIEDSDHITLHDIIVRRGQNGILLDRVNDSAIYDNDCSFLSGWGIGLWRSSRNTISRNAVDFCIRGHSEGVYNRGQDSAGFLVFEQCRANVFAENSATHCGDGFFGFAGKEALGEVEPRSGTLDYSRVGCDDNIIIDNDFSYAAAHGLELTFSHGNQILRNRFVENAICGIWGGYSQETLIAENTFEGNGGMAYGKERGGINIEHGALNRIVANRFTNNKCAVRFWWNKNESLLSMPGVKASYRGVTGNAIHGNAFNLNLGHPFTTPKDAGVILSILEIENVAGGRVAENTYFDNNVSIAVPNATELVATPGTEPAKEGKPEGYRAPKPAIPGTKHPVGARDDLKGRAMIHMGPWGPWDHQTPMIRLAARNGSGIVYEMFGGKDWSMTASDPMLNADTAEGLWPNSRRLIVLASPGVTPYEFKFKSGEFEETVSGTMIATQWQVTFFPWTHDPRTELEAWRAEADGEGAVAAHAIGVDFPFGNTGPRRMLPQDLLDAKPKSVEMRDDHFGVIAKTRIELPTGRWRFRTLSDDGVRVMAGSTTVVENWSWHAPTTNEGVYEQMTAGVVDLTVEYFELDGYAVLKLEIEPDK